MVVIENLFCNDSDFGNYDENNLNLQKYMTINFKSAPSCSKFSYNGELLAIATKNCTLHLKKLENLLLKK